MTSPSIEVLIEECLSGQGTAAFRASLESNDLLGLAVVATCDNPDAERFAAIQDVSGGAEAAAALAFAAVVSEGASATLSAVAVEHMIAFGHKLALTQAQADSLFALLATGELDDDRATAVFGWLVPHQTERCLEVSMDHVDEAAGVAPSNLLKGELALLGASGREAHHTALASYSQRLADANLAPQAIAVLIAIEAPNDEDAVAAGSVLSKLLARGQPIPQEIHEFFSRLSDPQVRKMIESLSLDAASTQRFDTQVLPPLFAARAEDIIPTLTSDLWPASSRNWILDNAPWGEHDDRLLIQALDRVASGGDTDAASRLRGRLVEQMIEAAGDDRPKSAMPRLGARTLLRDALDGRIGPDDTSLQAGLRALAAEARQEEYLAANWRTPKRARRLGAVVAAIDIEDATAELIDHAFSLKDEAAAAWIESICASSTDDRADDLVSRAKGRTVVLNALARSAAGAGALRRAWEEHDDLEAFEGLASSQQDDFSRIDHVPTAVRNYSSSLTIDQRLALMRELEADSRVDLVMGILADRADEGARAKPPNGLLAGALRLTAVDLKGRDPGELFADLAILARTHPQPSVRRATYEVLGVCSPTSLVVTLLLERREDEVPGLSGDVDTALEAVANVLNERVASTAGNEKLEALGLLDDVDPSQAVPHARHLLEDQVEDPAHRVFAAQLLGSHGDDSDIERLRKTVEDEPDATTREVLSQAIRKLEVGDIAAAHLRIGEFTDIDQEVWAKLDPADVWGNRADALVAGMNRVSKFQAAGDLGSTVDQLGAEIAKLILYHTIDRTGDELNLSPVDRAAIRDNQLDYGDVVVRQQLASDWRFVGSLAELYRLRSEHLTPKGTWDPVDELTDEDYEHALWLFRRGVGPCLERLAEASS